MANEPGPIVERAGWSGRTRLLLAVVVIDAIAVAVVLAVLAR